MDPEKTRAIVRSKKMIDFSWEVARKALLVVRDDKKLLPLKPSQKILVVEQKIPYEFVGKDMYSHQHIFCEQMTKHSSNLILDDTGFAPSEEDAEEVLELAKQTDLVVITNYYARIVKGGNNREIVRRLKEAGHKVVVVTNYPYIEGTTKEADAVICNFSGSPDSIRISADLLFGKVKTCPTTRMPISNLTGQAAIPAPKLQSKKKLHFGTS
jgi:hypothetical protein